MAMIESKPKWLILLVLKMLLRGKMVVIAVLLLVLQHRHAVIQSNGMTVLMFQHGPKQQVSMKNIQFILIRMATFCGGCGMDLLVTGSSTSKLFSYNLLSEFKFSTPGAHGNDIAMSEQADAACPDEFSAWTMTCAGTWSKVTVRVYVV